jgi:hypothetical protein
MSIFRYTAHLLSVRRSRERSSGEPTLQLLGLAEEQLVLKLVLRVEGVAAVPELLC